MANSSAETESRAVNVSNDNDNRQEKQSASLVTQGLQSNNDNRLTDNVNKGMIKQKTAYCENEPCGKTFEKTVSWKRFCSDDCRKENWETKHGKKLNLSKKKG